MNERDTSDGVGGKTETEECTMKKRLSAALAGAFLALSVAQAMPAPVTAAEEYLIRDKWGYCKTANYVESEHFVIFYGNNDTTGKVNDAFLKRNLEDYEKLWKCYGEYCYR